MPSFALQSLSSCSVPAGVFGAILVGSREVLEGEHTPLALFAMAATGINPNMRRASSGGVELQVSY